ncbi:DUF3352 domain-containing protein [Nocardioides sp. Iso805N]|uniref:DUF3352 domain-containing protein n=1 Tax=Nocardioides sp. Iso805N TaxID=1283287 RepID=UPI000378499C|nr:DUF3352 domain-containing protein [Nocardioides sp. Iso805N]
MSDQQPPAGGPSYGPSSSGSQPNYGAPSSNMPMPPPDTVTLGGGAWNDPKGDRHGRTWWYVGGGAVAAIALVAGGTVFAASHIGNHHDPGPAAGLPSDTLAYAGIDLDPSAGQKIEAIKALRTFPAFAHGLSIDPSSDLRKLLVQDQLKSDGCSLDWSKDVAPWLGNDIGAALVPTAGNGAQPVAVLAVTDEAAAKKDLPKLLDCAQLPHGLSVAHGWAVVAATDNVARGVSTGAESGSLGDDTDFKTWVDRTGDPGVATFYASKDAGKTMAGYLDKAMTEFGSATGSSSGSSSYAEKSSGSGFSPAGYTSASGLAADDGPTDDPADPFGLFDTSGGDGPMSSFLSICPRPGSGAAGGTALSTPQLELQKQALEQLQGGAATLRFAHGGFEVESAAAAKDAQASGSTAGSTGLATLPSDTAVAFGSGNGGQASDTWFTSFTQDFAQSCGTTPAKVSQGLTKLTGLTLPADLDTLFGKGVTFAASGSIDPEALSNSTEPTDLAVGLKLQGDPEQINGVLQKLKLPDAQQILGTTSGDGVVAVGPDADYRAELVKDGSLGKSHAFTDVIPHADKATSAFFVSFDNMRKILDSDAAGVPADARANLQHLQAFGSSSWVEDGISHGLMRLSTK